MFPNLAFSHSIFDMIESDKKKLPVFSLFISNVCRISMNFLWFSIFFCEASCLFSNRNLIKVVFFLQAIFRIRWEFVFFSFSFSFHFLDTSPFFSSFSSTAGVLIFEFFEYSGEFWVFGWKFEVFIEIFQNLKEI